MMRKLIALFLFALPVYAVAQNTVTLTGTLQTTDGYTLDNAYWQANLVNTRGQTPTYTDGTPVPQVVTGTLSSAGAISGTLGNNSKILPAGTAWQFTICPVASITATSSPVPGTCITYNAALVMDSSPYDVQSNLGSSITPLKVPSGALAYGYAPSEVQPSGLQPYPNAPAPGQLFFNTTTDQYLFYNPASASWQILGQQTLQTNSVNNLSQALLNIESSPTIAASNPSGGIVQLSLVGGTAVNTVTGGSGLTCAPTSGAVNCSLNTALPSTTTATTQATGDTSTLVATDQFVKNQIVAGTSIYYGSAYAIAATNDNIVTFASTPLKGSVVLYQNGVLVPPLDYNVINNVLTLNGFVFAASSEVTVYWQTYNNNPGGVTLSSSNYLAPAIRQTTQTYFATTCSSCLMPIPPLAQVGDMVAFIVSNSANPTSLGTTGFTLDNTQQGSQGGASIVYGVLTAPEIAAGTVQINYVGSYNPTVLAVDFAGATGGYRESDGNYANNVTTISASTTSTVAAGDVVLATADANFLTTSTLTPGTTIATYFGPSTLYNRSTQIYNYFPVSTAGVNTFTATYSSSSYVDVILFVFKASSSATVLPPGGVVTDQYLKITSGICTTAGAETTCPISATWPQPFANNTYAYGCSYAGIPTGTGTNPGLYGPYVSSPTTTGFTVTIQAGSNSAGGNNTVPEIDCWGHD